MHVTDSIAALRASCRLVKRLETPLRQLYSVDANMPTLTQNRAPDVLKSFGYSNFTSSSYTCFVSKHKSYPDLPWIPFSGNYDLWSALNIAFQDDQWEFMLDQVWPRNSCPSDFLPHTSEGHLVDGPLPCTLFSRAQNFYTRSWDRWQVWWVNSDHSPHWLLKILASTHLVVRLGGISSIFQFRRILILFRRNSN